jgi:hypothetical protein
MKIQNAILGDATPIRKFRFGVGAPNSAKNNSNPERKMDIAIATGHSK